MSGMTRDLSVEWLLDKHWIIAKRNALESSLRKPLKISSCCHHHTPRSVDRTCQNCCAGKSESRV
eukprot:3182700-Rhodomonas_salina.1